MFCISAEDSKWLSISTLLSATRRRIAVSTAQFQRRCRYRITDVHIDMVTEAEKRTPEAKSTNIAGSAKLPVSQAGSLHPNHPSGFSRPVWGDDRRCYWNPRPDPARRLVSIFPPLTVKTAGSFFAHFVLADGQYCRAFPSMAATPGIRAARLTECRNEAPGQVRS